MTTPPHVSPPPADLLPGEEPEAQLLSLSEAAVITGLSRKALEQRVARGTLPAEMHRGKRVVRRGELQRAGLIGAGSRANRAQTPSAEVELYRDLYEKATAELVRERELRQAEQNEHRELQLAYIAIANASGIHAWKLKRAARQRQNAPERQQRLSP